MSQMPPPSQPMQASMQPHRGVMILVFSILSWFICVIFGIVAWILANSDLQAMEEGRMDPSGEGLTKAGKIVSMISVILSIIGVVVGILFLLVAVVVGGAAAASGAGGGP